MIAVLTGGSRVWASSRLRGWWLQDTAPAYFRVYGPGDKLTGLSECDVVVFQKRHSEADLERMLRLRSEGVHVVYDMTDPLYLWQPNEIGQAIQTAHVVTCSSPALARFTRTLYPATVVDVIADRMLPEFHPTTRKHANKPPVRLVWFGDVRNRVGLTGALPLVEYVASQRPVVLRVIDNAPEYKVELLNAPVEHVPWTLETFHANLVDCDIALIPPYPGIWGTLKSNNREQSAAWAGLPVWSGQSLDGIFELIDDHALRAQQGKAQRNRAILEYNITDAVEGWLTLAHSLTNEAGYLNYRKPIGEAHAK